MKLRNWFKSRLIEPSTHAGVAGFLSGIGLILNNQIELGVATIFTSIVAVVKKEGSNIQPRL
ncbi:MAG: hypothetical protein ACK5BE_07095 [Alphaproteobacteria bacterium]|jgi:hypothetical protein